MMKRFGHFIVLGCAIALGTPSLPAHAVSLDKIEVTSRLGETFFARIPVTLEEGETASQVLVEIASPGDYRIFEVYRESIVDSIRADVTSGDNGTYVVLSSPTGIDSPFFNLVLKMQYGRVAHFKKFPVVLETSKGVIQAADQAPVPVVEKTAAEQVPAVVEQPNVIDGGQAQPNYFDGWARADRYGPIVRGDSLSTVASRLRLDKRYSMGQVMVALFEKNRDKFDQDNINLLKAGSYLNVPTAAEVEQLTKAQAYARFIEHEKRWKELSEQPRYAAEAEAQRTRYTAHVGMGEVAGGVASAPVVAEAENKAAEPAQAVAAEVASTADESVPADDAATQESAAAPEDAANVDELTNSLEEASIAAAEDRALLDELKTQNENLQKQLADSNEKIAELGNKLDQLVNNGQSSAKIEKLELMLSQGLKQLEERRAQPVQGESNSWLIGLLAGLVGVLGGVVLMLLMRREPSHPGKVEDAPIPAVADAEKVTAVADELADAAATTEAAVADAASSGAALSADEEDVFASIDGFSDELNDTATAEMEAFDPSLLDEEPDPDVDYLSEADVYIRYGMHDEAQHQLDMALKLNPTNVNAHLKKVGLLNNLGNESALNLAVGAATAVLAGAALERFLSEVEAMVASEEAAGLDEDVAEAAASEDQDGDFDFTVGDISGLVEAEDKAKAEAEAQAKQSDDDFELDWLRDEEFTEDDHAGHEELNIQEPVAQQTVEIDNGHTSTQMLDHLLGEFGDEFADDSESDFDAGETIIISRTADTAVDESSSTQQLDQLLGEFGDELLGLDDEAEVTDAPVAAAVEEPVEEIAPNVETEIDTSMEGLEHLFGDFDDSAQEIEFAEQPDLAVESLADDEGVEHLLDNFAEEAMDAEDAVTRDHEAEITESEVAQLDEEGIEHLLGEFAEEAMADEAEPDLLAPESAVIEQVGVAELVAEPETEEATVVDLTDEKSLLGDAESLTTTDELDRLLSEFEADDEDIFSFADDGAVGLPPIRVPSMALDDAMGATQRLDLLLGELDDDDEFDSLLADTQPAEALTPVVVSEVEPAADATQELDSLIDEFEAAEESVSESVEPVAVESIESVDAADFDDSREATEGLNDLLGEFATVPAFEMDDALSHLMEAPEESAELAESDREATEELNDLLGEFALTESDADADKEATEELNDLLGEFMADKDEDSKKA